jgi:TonB family protein
MKKTLRFVTSASIALTFVAINAFGQAPPSRLTGTVSDASGTAVGRATVILSKAAGRTEAIATSSGAGAYLFAGLQAGSYTLQVFAVGFGPSRMTTVQLEGGKDLKQDLTMDIGYVQDSTSAPATAPAPVMRPPTVSLSRPTPGDPFRPRLSEEGSSQNLTVKPEPAYPELAKQARIEGIVIVEVAIGPDGAPKNITVISGHPLLQVAAIDTVKNYRYRPLVINGSPTEFVTTVTVPFRYVP